MSINKKQKIVKHIEAVEDFYTREVLEYILTRLYKLEELIEK